MSSVINIFLRGLTLGCKFLLVVFLAKLLTLEELALYGLLVATVAYAIYPLGFEFYTYSARELIGTDNSERGEYFKSQAVLHIISYLVFLPLFALIFYFDFLPHDYILLFYIILILEHLNQELFRIQ